MTLIQRLPLRTTLVGLFVGQILVAVGLVGYLSFRNGQSATNHLAAKLQMETTRRVQDRLNHFLATPQQVAGMSYQAARWGQLDLNDPVALEQEFWQKAKLFPAISSMYMATPTGQFTNARRVGAEDIDVLSVSSPDSTLMRHQTDPSGNRTTLVAEFADYDPRMRPWYLRGVEAQQPLWGPVFSWSDPEPTLGMTAIHPLRDEADQLVAIFAVDLSLFSINDFLATLEVGESGEVFLMERDGTLMATSVGRSVDPETLSSLPAEESDNALIREAGTFLARRDLDLGAIAEDQQFRFTADRARYLMQVTPYQDDYGLDWLIVVVLPESDFMAQINANTRTSIMLCILALGVATILGIATSRWIAQPILRFNQAAEAIAQGNLSQRISCDRLVELCTMAETFNRMSSQLSHSFEDLSRAHDEIRLEQEKSEKLLLNILPASIVAQLKETPDSIADHFYDVTILFADIVGFTPLSERLSPLVLVKLLNDIFSQFDALAGSLGLEKIKTIGDAYMVAAGLPIPRQDHAAAIADMALAMLAAVNTYRTPEGERFQIRIGINSGAAVAGVIGTKKFIYDLWGDAVNIASRMESHGEPNRIHVTEATYLQLCDRYRFEERGEIEIKGKGKLNTYWLVEKLPEPGGEALP